MKRKKHYAGVIRCGRLRREIKINEHAVPGKHGFVCDCGHLTSSDRHFHTVFYHGEQV